MKAREEAWNALRGASRPLLVTHWDMDGVASAVAASWYTGGRPVGVYVPPLTYRLRWRGVDVAGEIARAARKADVVVMTDLAYPDKALAEIRAALPGDTGLLVIDHHKRPAEPRVPGLVYYNPVVQGLGDPGDWPSTAHVVVDLAGGRPADPLLVAASIAGDLGDAAVVHPAFRRYMEMAGLDPEADYQFVVENCVRMVDSAPSMGDVGPLVTVIEFAAIYGEAPCEVIIKNALLVSLKEMARAELQALLSEARPRHLLSGRIQVYELEGDGMHASKLARALAARHPGSVVVVSYKSRRLGQAKVYARVYGSSEPPLASLVSCLEARGFSAGGKTQDGNNVVAVEADEDEAGDALEAVVEGVARLLERRSPC